MATNKRLIKSNDEGGAGGASFNTVLYDGNGYPNSGTKEITGVGFQPDLTWIKARNTTAYHILVDSIRGVNKYLFSNVTFADFTQNGTGFLSFDPDGFSLGADTNGDGVNRTNDGPYVAWCWKAAGYANTFNVLENGSTTSSATAAGAGIAAGSLTNGWSVSANRDAGFSIVSYTGNLIAGATVGHGLGVEPDMIIVKERSQGTGGWLVYHSALGTAANVLYLNGTAPEQIGVNTFNGTNPTDSVFSLGYNGEVNDNGQTNIAYCFAEVAGFSKFGSYTGTGEAGNFQDCGFEPAFVMIKSTTLTSAGSIWFMYDNKRQPSNPRDTILRANDSSAESNFGDATLLPIDFLENGFTINGTYDGINGTGNSYIYMAFANQF